jgi:hypothetical protein
MLKALKVAWSDTFLQIFLLKAPGSARFLRAVPHYFGREAIPKRGAPRGAENRELKRAPKI